MPTLQVFLQQFGECGGRVRGEALIQLRFFLFCLSPISCPKRLLKTVAVFVPALIVEDASFLV